MGPLIIHGPSSGDWDVDLGPVLIQDYVHETSFIAYENEKTETNFARADSIVVNGLGHDPATGTGSYFNTKFTPGKKHLLRLINSSAGTTFIFSIDDHPFQVVANDLVAIEPFTTTSLTIGIGTCLDFDPSNFPVFFFFFFFSFCEAFMSYVCVVILGQLLWRLNFLLGKYSEVLTYIIRSTLHNHRRSGSGTCKLLDPHTSSNPL